MKTIYIKAHQRRRIISRFSNSVPTTYHFSASHHTSDSSSNDQQVSGIVEVKGSNWLFPKAPVSQKLMADNSVAKTAWDSLYSVYVTPDQDVRIDLESGQIQHKLVYMALIAGIVAIALSLSLIGLWR